MHATDADGDTALQRAAHDDRLDLARLLLDRDTDPDAADDDLTPLERAISEGAVRAARLLWERTDGPRQPDSDATDR